MTRPTSRFVIAAAIAAAGACSSDGAATDQGGELRLALTGRSTTGTVYRLRDAQLTIAPAGVVLSTEDDPDREILSAELDRGLYTIDLAPGWRLERFENGVAMTQRNCKQQFEQSLRGIVSRIRDRRFVAVDRERGIVFAFAFFDHEQINWTWQLAELFKIENGLIRRVEAVFHRAPYGTPSGWSTFEQAMSESIQSVR